LEKSDGFFRFIELFSLQSALYFSKTKILMKNYFFLFLYVLAMLVTSCSTIKENENSIYITPQQDWQKWKTEYQQELRSNDGWLSLVGLYWLKEGDNSIGSANTNQHKFPKGTPKKFGQINISNNVITFTRASDKILINDKNIRSQKLILNKTIVSFDTYSFYVIKREKGFAIRLQSSANPAITNFKGTKFYPYNKSLRIPARLIKPDSSKKIAIKTVYQTVRQDDFAGWLELEYQGKLIRLKAVSYGDKYPMSVMFVDETSQETTYGAGRYLDVEWPKNGERTIIDFNYAYNPPCAFTKFATCPLPPQSNRLDFSVDAGELFEEH